jgi:hypothetical protein
MSDISSCSRMLSPFPPPLFPFFPFLKLNQGLRRSRYSHYDYNRIPTIRPRFHSHFGNIESSMTLSSSFLLFVSFY